MTTPQLPQPDRQECEQQLLTYCRPLAQNWAHCTAIIPLTPGSTTQVAARVRGRFQAGSPDDVDRFFLGDRQNGQWNFREAPQTIIFQIPDLLGPSGT